MLRKRREIKDKMTLVGHLTELRRRIIFIISALVIGVLVGFYFSGSILKFLLTIPGELVYLYPGEAFFVHMKLAIIIGIVIASPVLLAQLLGFVFPALQQRQRKKIVLALPFMLTLMVIGIFFAYTVILPITYRFFMEFGTEMLQPLISVGSYVSFVLGITLPFGIVFQLPMIVLLLTSIGIITPELLTRSRKIMMLVIFIIAAILTPPDVISQVLMAIPMLLLYELSVVIAKVVFRRRLKQ